MGSVIEEDAQRLVLELVGREGSARLETMIDLILAENEKQNLIARSTIPTIWWRHVLDSVQLLRWAGDGESWLDVGTGGGFPGLAIAVVDSRPMTLVEPRSRRAAFLAQAAEKLGLAHVTVLATKIERVSSLAATISARAVAPIENLLRASQGCATETTRWLLPRGQLGAAERETLERQYGALFHVEQSLSDPSSSVVIIEQGHAR